MRELDFRGIFKKKLTRPARPEVPGVRELREILPFDVVNEDGSDQGGLAAAVAGHRLLQKEISLISLIVSTSEKNTLFLF